MEDRFRPKGRRYILYRGPPAPLNKRLDESIRSRTVGFSLERAVQGEVVASGEGRLFQLVADEGDRLADPFSDEDVIADEPVWTTEASVIRREVGAETAHHQTGQNWPRVDARRRQAASSRRSPRGRQGAGRT